MLIKQRLSRRPASFPCVPINTQFCPTLPCPALPGVLQACEHCGIAVHPRCSRYAAEDCRPLCMRVDSIPHDWKPAGALMPVTQVCGAGV